MLRTHKSKKSSKYRSLKKWVDFYSQWKKRRRIVYYDTPSSVSTFTKSNLFSVTLRKVRTLLLLQMKRIAPKTNLFVWVYVHRENAVYYRKLLESLLKEANYKIIHWQRRNEDTLLYSSSSPRNFHNWIYTEKRALYD